jgi:putative ABC transport system permease protein
MNFTNTLTTAITAIFTNKVRSLLTVLGVVIGVASVVLLIAIGDGLQLYITNQFNSLGANTLYVLPGDILGEGGSIGSGQGFSALINNKLKYQYTAEIKRLGYPIVKAISVAESRGKVRYKNKEHNAQIIGSDPDYPNVLNIKPVKGNFFTASDNNNKRRVVFLGAKSAEKLFDQIDPIGKQVYIKSQAFTVVGVAESKGGSMGGPSIDDHAAIPLQTYFNLYDTKQITEYAIQVDSQEQMPEANKLIKELLGSKLKDDEFSVMETKDILSAINKILGVLTMGLGGIAAISLVVGGIGIMNIMLVSVTERTKEIGLRKALGATPNVILTQFLIESSMLSVLGGAIGLIIAVLLSALINRFFPCYVTISAVTLAFSVSAITGIVFGVAPARRASKLSPIEALRYE